MFAAIYAPSADTDRLIALAREWSPRIEREGRAVVILDICGVERLFGDAETVGRELQRAATALGQRPPAQVGVAATRTCAVLIAYACEGVTVIPRGHEARTLAPLPLSLLRAIAGGTGAPGLGGSSDMGRSSDLGGSPARTSLSPAPTSGDTPTPAPVEPPAPVHPHGAMHYRLAPGPPASRADVDQPLQVLARWGLRTLGDVAALPAAGLRARLGEQGAIWQRVARGLDAGPLVPAGEEPRFEETLELEWPVEGLEPLSFVLGRLLEALCGRLMDADRGAAALQVHLRLVTRETWTRRLELPAPFRDARVLRTLALLDLESHPPPAAIDVVAVRVDPTPARVVQFSLLERERPSAEQLSTLLARLRALMGARRADAPALVDSHRPEPFAMAAFTGGPSSGDRRPSDGDEDRPRVGLRRFRHPVPIRVRLTGGRPAHVAFEWGDLRGGSIATAAGPWRASGEWWTHSTREDGDARSGQASTTHENAELTGDVRDEDRASAYNRDEWDVATADGSLYVIYRDRTGDRWFLAAMMD